MIDGVYGDHRGGHFRKLELVKGFRHKAAAHFVPVGGIKRGEGEDVQLCWYILLHYFPVRSGLRLRSGFDARQLTLPALAGLRRKLKNEAGEARDGYETRILQIAIGKLYVELLLDVCDEFYDLHGSEPSRREIIYVAESTMHSLALICRGDLCSGHKPLGEPVLDRCSRLLMTHHF